MSQRKLQQDIDKLLKKVKEGLEEYEKIYEKFQSTDAENTSYREKLESDLKREIKKLQKQREQIKTWLSKEDVKDKQDVLSENRRLIENGMERFKTLEKQMKTKQFSTEALSNPDLIKDPKEAKKQEQFIFIQNCIEELQKQLDIYEVEENAEQIERHEFHIKNLENILKLLQNDEMEPDTVVEFQEDIKYYVDNNSEPDFIEYDTIYDDMACEVKVDESNEKNEALTASDSNTLPANATLQNQKTQKKQEKQDRLLKKKQTSDSSVLASTTNPAVKSTPTGPSSPSKQSTKTNVKKKSIVIPVEEVHFPTDQTEKINEIIANDIKENSAFENPLFEKDLKAWINSKKFLLQPPNGMSPRAATQLESSLLNCPDSLDADTPYLYQKPLSTSHPTSIFFPAESIRFVCSMDSYKQQQQGINNQDSQLRNQHAADFGLSSDANKLKNNKKDNVEDIYSNTSLARIFTKFDLDTLFFIFYHYQGTYEQFLAARELAKNRKWEYNKVDNRWYFKEVEKLPPGMPQTEEISWRYFDYQKSWLLRRCNSDFVYNPDEFENLE